MKTLTNIITRSILVIGIVMSGTQQVHAQEEEKEESFVFSGSVDTYFRTNFNSTNDPENGGMLAPASSFANLSGFSLGMANVIGEYSAENVGVVIDLVFGPRGVDAVFGSEAPLNIVNQLYAYWNINEKVTFTIGNFNTFLGYEVISPTGNFNYSTSYMFSYGPFSHTGLKFDFDLGNGFTFMGGVFNPTDATDFNPSNQYYGGTQIGYSNDAGSIYLNTLFIEDFFQVDVTTGWDLSESFYLGFNSTYATDNFYGVATYLQYSVNEKLGLGTRLEYFVDEGIGILSEGESVTDITLSANYTIGPLTLIPEVRTDLFSEPDYVITDASPTTLSTANSLSSFVFAAVFAF